MRITREVVLGERRISCREMLLGEVRAWLADVASSTPDLIGDELIDGITLAELARMCDLDLAAADAMSPSEIAQVAEACRECNPHFFALRARLLERGRRLSGASSAQPAPSSAPATPASGTTPIASS